MASQILEISAEIFAYDEAINANNKTGLQRKSTGFWRHLNTKLWNAEHDEEYRIAEGKEKWRKQDHESSAKDATEESI